MRPNSVDFLRRLIPARAKAILRRPYHALVEGIERVLGRHDPLVPPGRLMFVGGTRRDFRSLGNKWVQTFIRVAELKPDEQVLDVGCGNGRMAVALTQYLSPQGRYEGFDIVKAGIDWCEHNISTRFTNFGFRHADVHNAEYNPGGRLDGSQYRFPYPDESFDFVFLTSVFTHMLPRDVRHYTTEVGRVLKPTGRCLSTFFLMNPEARQLIDSGAVGSERSFRCNCGEHWTMGQEVAEAAVAYSEESVRELFRNAGLFVQRVLYGAWCGRPNPSSSHSQDIVLAGKQSG